MRKIVMFKLHDYKKNPEHTIKLIVHTANMGGLDEGSLEKVKPSDANASVDVWHAVIGQSTAEITISKQKSEAIVTTLV
jgi:hypothetical protein